MRPRVQGGLGWRIGRGLAPQPGLTPEGPGRGSDAREARGFGLQRLAPLCRPGSALRRRAQAGRRELWERQTGLIVVHTASPRQWAPRALGGGHRLHHGVVLVPGGGPIVADRDHVETWRVAVVHAVRAQGRPVWGPRGRP